MRPWLLAPVYERLANGQAALLAELRPAYPLFLQFGTIDHDADPDTREPPEHLLGAEAFDAERRACLS